MSKYVAVKAKKLSDDISIYQEAMTLAEEIDDIELLDEFGVDFAEFYNNVEGNSDPEDFYDYV